MPAGSAAGGRVEVTDGEMGSIVREWLKTAELRPRGVVDAFVVISDPMHGIIGM